MTSSRSNASTNKLLLVIGAILLVTSFGMRTADADRKRVVILPFDGEKAEKFHASMVKLVKKSHSVVSKDKWESIAEDLGATGINEKNVKKVAKKMKVDGVIEGTITKRRDEYLVKLKLRSGKDGKVVGNVSTKSESTKLDGDAAKEIKDELIAAIDNLESADDGGDDDAKPAKKGKKDDEDAKPAKKGKKDDDDDAKPAKKGKKDDDEDAKPAKKGKKDDDDDKKDDKKGSKFGNGQMKADKDKKDDEKPAKKDDEANALKTKKDDEAKKDDSEDKPRKKDKKVAKKDDDGGDIEKGTEGGGKKMDAATALSPGNRAIDATFGLSFNTRRLAWKADGDLQPSSVVGQGQGKPPNYKGVPAPGAIVDVVIYPMAFSHKNEGITKDIGVNFIFDRALLISSESGGEKLKTQAQRYLVGPTFRYPLGKGPKAPVVGGMLRYGSQLFTIDGADIPNVNYGMIVPGAFFKYGFGDKLIINAQANFMLVTKAGPMQRTEEYGGTKGTGFNVDVGADYMLAQNLFARGGLRFESISTKFDGTGMKTTMRDADPEQDVQGATDTYIGAAFTIGFLY